MIGPQNFQDKIEPIPFAGCWIWIGARDRGGYGSVTIKGKSRGAHRVAYEYGNGPIPDGLDLDHKCRVRCCVNPDHLEPVTHKVNIERGDTGKHNTVKTHCPHGHEYTEENTFYRKRKDGYRIRNCRICSRREVAEYKARKWAALNGIIPAIALALGLALSGVPPAQAQAPPPVTAYPPGWTAIPQNNLQTDSLSGASTAYQLTWAAQTPPPVPVPSVVKVCNTGIVAAYVALGPNSGTTATTASSLVQAGACVPLMLNGNSYIAGITGGGNTTITVETGSGWAFAGGLGSSGGSGVYMFTTGTNSTAAALGNINTNSTGFLTAGSVIFSDGNRLAQDNANFFWDSTNHRLGIGTTGPTYPFQINGASTTALRAQVAGGGGTVASFGGLGDFQIDALGVVAGRFVVKESGGIAVGRNIDPGSGNLALGAASGSNNFRIYNSFTDASNGEWGEMSWGSNILTIGTNNNGTGAARNINLEVGGISVLSIGSSFFTINGPSGAAALIGVTANQTNGTNASVSLTPRTGAGGVGIITTGNASSLKLQTNFSDAITITSAQLVALPAITTDATHTDSTVCQDTSTHSLYFGSGTLGICLGTSSMRFKRDVEPLTDGLAQIMALRPKNFFYDAQHGDRGARRQYGFMAEDVVHVLPGLVPLDGAGLPQSVDILGMVPVIVRGMQEQERRIQALEKGRI